MEPVVLTNEGINQINGLYSENDELKYQVGDLNSKLKQSEESRSALEKNVTELTDKINRLASAYETISHISDEDVQRIAAAAAVAIAEVLPKPPTRKVTTKKVAKK